MSDQVIEFRPCRQYSYAKFPTELPDYKIGSDGSVWSRKKKNGRGTSRLWRRLKPRLCRKGYLLVCISHKGQCHPVPVHRLVLWAFAGPAPAGMECCHNDGNRQNANIENLRWDTHSNNMKDAHYIHKTTNMPCLRGEDNPVAVLNNEKVRKIKKWWATGNYTLNDIGRFLKVDHGVVRAVIIGKTWKHVT